VSVGVIGGSTRVVRVGARPKVGLGELFEMVSRETMLLTNNVCSCRQPERCCSDTLITVVHGCDGAVQDLSWTPRTSTGGFWFVQLMTPGLFLMGIGTLAR